jgi:uncharacterized membrane protein YbhN (UPF0104 family)
VVCIWVTFIILRQVNQQQKLQEAWQLLISDWSATRIYIIGFVFFLMLCNWSVEAWKWKLLLKPLQHISFGRSLRSVFTGISISLLTPNRIGEYAGRIIYLQNDNKLKGIAVNMVSSFAQFIAASVFGIFGCVYYLLFQKPEWYLPYILIGSIIVLFLLSILYFKLDNCILWLEKFTILHKLSNYMQVVKTYNANLLLRIIIFSAGRYFIFACQYYFLLQAFQIQIAFAPALLSIFLIFWLMAIIPTIAIAELPIRAEMSYRILQVFSSNVIGIMSASVLLWLINLIIPALLGGIVLIGAKFSDSQNEEMED